MKKASDTMLNDEDGPNLDEAMAEAEENLADMKSKFSADDISLSAEDWEHIEKKLKEDAIAKAKRDHKRLDALREAMHEIDSMLHSVMDYDSEGLIDEKTLREIKELEDSDYSEYDLDGSIPTVSNKQKKITWRNAKDSERSREIYKSAVRDLKPQINTLKRKLNLYGNLNKYTVRNQKIGKIDKRRLHRIPMGMTDLFKIDVIQQDKPLDICLLVDESGSMGYNCMEYARNASIVLKEALGSNEQLNLWVFGHSADQEGNGTTEMIEYSSPRMKDRPMAMGGMRARCENRDGNAIVAATQRVAEQTDQPQANKLLLILSDGAPSADRYRGDVALRHTKKCVDYVEGRRWSVIQLGFKGAYEYHMARMFKNWVYIPDIGSLGKDVTKIIRKVLKV
jgi:nitric oxide reductase activation protein